MTDHVAMCITLGLEKEEQIAKITFPFHRPIYVIESKN